MKLTPIKANMTELDLPNGYVLFSYQTPVAATIRSTGEVFKTEKKWSKTTSRHINQWLQQFSNIKVTEKPQDFFDNLVK